MRHLNLDRTRIGATVDHCKVGRGRTGSGSIICGPTRLNLSTGEAMTRAQRVFVVNLQFRMSLSCVQSTDKDKGQASKSKLSRKMLYGRKKGAVPMLSPRDR